MSNRHIITLTDQDLHTKFMVLNTTMRYHSCNKTLEYLFSRSDELTALQSENLMLHEKLEKIQEYAVSKGVTISNELLNMIPTDNYMS